MNSANFTRNKSPEQRLASLYAFRKQMGTTLSKDVLEGTGLSNLSEDTIKQVVREGLQAKRGRNDKLVQFARTKVDKLITKSWFLKKYIKSVGISGSIASGKYKKGDDIDLFIICRNRSAWLVRMIILLNTINDTDYLRYNSSSENKKLCINLYLEERALYKERNLFIYHEVLYLIPLINPSYIKIFRTKYDDFFSGGEVKVEGSYKDLITVPLNFVALLIQIGYMTLRGHRPDFTRIFKGFRAGRIEFYPKEFSPKVLEKLKAKVL